MPDTAAIRAVIFDMDGVLIDTEPTWRRIEIDVYRSLGCTVNETDMVETMGVPILDVVRQWHSRFPWPEPAVEQVATDIVDAMVVEIATHGEPMPGVHDAIKVVRDRGLPMAIASSSPLRMIESVAHRLGIADAIDVVCSADDEVAGKPDPAVFLAAARRLGVAPAECLVIEDSPNGVRAAVAAGMTCVVVPDPHGAGHPAIATAHMTLASLTDFTPEWLRAIQPAFPVVARR